MGTAGPSTEVTDLSTGAVLVAEDADALRFPASLTKLMTLYLLFQELQNGRVSLQGEWTASSNAALQPPTRLGLRAGARISVEDCISALILRSANDTAVVVAENLARTESAFAEKMTAAARQLGMSRTVFRNASGLPDPDQVTTARDLTILAQAIIRRFPEYYHYFGTLTGRAAGRRLASHNSFLRLYDGADGLKTGYTQAAGYNLAVSAERCGHRLIGVVLGESSGPARSRKMVRIMDEGFARLDLSCAVEPRPVVRPVRRVRGRQDRRFRRMHAVRRSRRRPRAWTTGLHRPPVHRSAALD